MKKFLLVLFMSVALSGMSSFTVNAQTGFNTVIEYCTGTWCQWCPCGHTIIQNILTNYPNTMVLGYHGAGSDPWQSYSAGIRAIFGFSAYPTGVVGRRTGIISRSGWNNQVVIQSNTVQPGVSIAVNSKSYNPTTRTITASIVSTALSTLSGNYFINFVLTEGNMVYPQSGNSQCPGGSNYVHHHVVKGMINGDLGEALNTGGTWNNGQQIIKQLNYVIPAGFVADNCDINFLVYKQGGNISTDYFVQQTKVESVTGITGINNQNGTALEYNLSQNYPNPFNPTTNINFSIPNDGNVSFKIYDMLGNVVATYVDGFLKAGIYNAEVDGSGWASGVYFYRLQTDNFVDTKKMSLVK